MNLRLGLEFGYEHPQRGFTLLELLIAISIFALIATTIISTFNTGVKAWEKITEYTILSKDGKLALERMSRDLRNALRFPGLGTFSGLQFIGRPTLISIPGLISTSNPSVFQIGRITYFFNEADNSLQMRKENYAEVVNAIETKPRTLASSVVDLSVRYCRYDSQKDEYIWEEEYNQSDKFPLEVRITLTLRHPTSKEELTLTKTVLTPMGETPSEL